MKPLYIVVLVAAGAIGGAVIMKVALQPKAAVPPAVVAQVQPPPVTAPAPPVTPPAVPVSAPPAVAPAKPSPVEEPKPVRHVWKSTRTARAVTPSQPTGPAEPMPAAPVAPAPPPAPVEPAPQAVPPARAEAEHVTPPPPPAPEPHKVTLNAGMLIPVRLVDGLTTERNLPGDTFAATLDKELVVDGFVIAERGARVEGRVVASDKGGRVQGLASLSVELVRLRTSDGQTVAIRTDGFERRADETHRQDAEKIGGGAALGAIIGAIAGGGKGAAIGAGVGGGAGAGTVMATRGNAAKLPSETRVTFRLRAPVTITEKLSR